MKKNSPHIKAFTLVETLVAISIILVATTGPLVHIQNNLINTRYAQDQVIATYLAQEGIETIRALRDGNRISENSSFEGFDNCNYPNVCTVDAAPGTLEVCPVGRGEINISFCEPLRYTQSSGLYSYSSSGSETPFTRSLTMSAVPNNWDERKLTVTVVWETRPGKGRTIEVSEHLFDFQ